MERNELQKIIEIALSSTDTQNIELCYILACQNDLIQEFEFVIDRIWKRNRKILRRKYPQFKFIEHLEFQTIEYKKFCAADKIQDKRNTIGYSARQGMIAFNCGKHPAQTVSNNVKRILNNLNPIT